MAGWGTSAIVKAHALQSLETWLRGRWCGSNRAGDKRGFANFADAGPIRTWQREQRQPSWLLTYREFAGLSFAAPNDYFAALGLLSTVVRVSA